MTVRDSKGRFTKAVDDPFTQGRLPDEAAYNLSNDTLTALSRALTQAESDVRRYDAVS